MGVDEVVPGSRAVIAFALKHPLPSRPPRLDVDRLTRRVGRVPADSKGCRAERRERGTPELAMGEPSRRIVGAEAIGRQARADRAPSAQRTHNLRHTADGSKRALASPVVGEAGGERDFRRRLTIIVAFGAVLRIVRLVVNKWGHPLLLNDSLYYSAQAQQLAHRVWFREVFVDQPGAEHGPLTSTLMALVSWGTSPFDRQRMVTVACGIVTVAIIGLVGRRVGGDRVGLIAAAIAAVYPNLWISDGLVMSESVSCLLIALALWAAGVG